MARYVDIDKPLIIPVTDARFGDIKYDKQITLGELFEELVDGPELEVVDAIPVEWLNERHRKCCEDGDTDLMDAITVLTNEYHIWQEGQEVR